MIISKNIEIVNTALLINKEILVINDLHLGYEEALRKRGVLVPKFQLKEILTVMTRILSQSKPKKIIINGDLKHEFGSVLRQEWTEISQLLDFLQNYCKEIVIIKGNHDPAIQSIVEKRNIAVVNNVRINDILVVHGDKLVKTSAKRIIIGHEHPAITIREGSKWEKYKCFMKGYWKRNKELIAVPSFNPLIEGTDILSEQLLSPFLQNIREFTIYIVNEGEIFKFGKVKEFL